MSITAPLPHPIPSFAVDFDAKAVATALYTTQKYIVLALDDGNVHVLDSEGNNGRVIRFEAGPWAVSSK